MAPDSTALRDDTLLNWIPEGRFLSQRYPQLKERYYNLNIPADSITSATAYSSLPTSRIGYHNDCFLVAANDYTYSDTTAQKPFVATEAKYTLMGGETCGNSTFADCSNALKELERFHWTYLNDNYHPDVLNRWEQEGCYEEIAMRLGYRIVLDSLSWDDNDGVQGSPFQLTLYMRNTGFAAPVHNRNVEMVFHDNMGNRYTFSNPVTDIRTWQPGTIEWSVTGNLPESAPYELSLVMRDLSPVLADDPRYSIALANLNIFGRRVFDEQTGENRLFGLSVTSTRSQLEKEVMLPQNPIRDQLFIRSTTPDVFQVSLMNLSGQTLLVDAFTNDGEWDVSHLPAGMYVLRVQNGQGETASYKVVKVE